MKISKDEIAVCCFGVMVSLFLRLATSLHPYSGQGKAPMFGDYEAQRHWMEITVNLPMNLWYHNTTENDLNYWGLDYPPLTAYHSYLCGLIAYAINPSYVELFKSRGYESDDHKLFMRYTVLIADIAVYIPAVILYLIVVKGCSLKSRLKLHASIVISLLYPGLILIDHGHFQYNCVSLGLTVLAITCIHARLDILSAFLFCLALNYKQMELYHAFPFFLYLLSSCIPKPGEGALTGCYKLFKLALTVVLTFGVLWVPFLFNLKDFLQVVHRLFPIARGVFEDKVANVWCALNIVYKFKSYCAVKMVHYCTIATLTAVLPSSADLFLRPNIEKFVPALINSSLAFFLFSFQVHEKSILLAAIPAVLYLHKKPLPCFWFLFLTNFSMLHLFIKDNLVIAYLALSAFYMISFIYYYENPKSGDNFISFYRNSVAIIVGTKNKPSHGGVVTVTFKHFFRDKKMFKKLIQYIFMILSVLGCLILTLLILIFDPPDRYPDLFPLAISVYSCVHFILFFIYFNIVQFRIPQSFEDMHIKLKES